MGFPVIDPYKKLNAFLYMTYLSVSKGGPQLDPPPIEQKIITRSTLPPNISNLPLHFFGGNYPSDLLDNTYYDCIFILTHLTE